MSNFAAVQAQDYLKQGLAAGTALVVIEYVQKVQYYQNSMPYDHSTAIMLWSYLAILVLAGITYWAVVEARNEKGSLNFGQAFFVCIYVVFIASLMVGGFYYIYG